jgi:4-hydroxyphenylpyruvate dioxygenase
MRRSIATVSLSGTLDEKLRAIAAARFHAVELFEPDLVNFSGTPREVRRQAEDLGLAIDLFQPFRDFEGVPDDAFQRNLERAERKFDVMAELGAPMMLVCSNVQPDALGDEARATDQLRGLADRAARRNVRIGYEALAWGTHVRTYGQAWQIVRRVDHPHLGLVLDSFHTLVLGDDPAGILALPREKLFFVQIADAPRLTMDPLSWSRHFRSFPGQGELDVAGFLVPVIRNGYSGPLSLEVFNDVFRASNTRQTARDAMRSLLFLEEQVRSKVADDAAPDGVGGATPRPAAHRVELFDPPPVPGLGGIAFLEFAVDADAAARMGGLLQQLGFDRLGQHRSKAVTLYRQGEINLILNAEPESFARGYFELHGPALCAVGLWTEDEVQALARATALLATQFEGRVGPDELTIPAIRSIDNSLLYFVGQETESRRLFEIDFIVSEGRPPAGGSPGLRGVDHLAMALPPDTVDAWILFYRAILGLEPHGRLETAEPYGLMRSRAVVSANRTIRITLNASEGRQSMIARSLSTFAGSGVHHIAFACDDIFATVATLKAAGIACLAIPDNYYDELEARYGALDGLIARLREAGILYDRTADGAFFHIPTETFMDRFSFEIVQREGRYDGHGEVNAPTYLAAQARNLRSD